jgi:hypothetical protein
MQMGGRTLLEKQEQKQKKRKKKNTAMDNDACTE